MSLSENLHNLGALMKTNLEEKGINGLTGNEGLTTLANKILDIEGNGSSSKSVVAHITGNNVTIGKKNSTWLIATDDATINWGDGTSNTVNNPQETLSHTYTDGINGHLIVLDGTITGLGSDCFYGCSGLTSIFIPNSITSLGNNCFDGCSSLTSIVIPDSVTSIEGSCFEGCSGLTSITIPDSVTSLGYRCFYDCSGLTSIVIPDSVTSIEGSCFEGCSGLTSVTIPDSVTSIGGLCFYECSGLTSVVIPDSVTSIGTYCFNDCPSLVDYELYWETSPITYVSHKMPVNNGTVFTIPTGTRQLYIDAGYPSNNLVERGETLTLTCDKPIIQKTETSTVTATLKQSGSPLTGKTLNYQVKHGNTVISSGTKTTNSSGQATISYTGTGVGDVDIVVSYDTLLQETYEITDCMIITANDSASINYIKSSSAMRATFDDEYLSLTVKTDVSNGNYCGLYWSTDSTTIYGHTLSEFLGKSFKIDFDIVVDENNLNHWLCAIYAYVNGSFSTLSRKDNLTSGEHSVNFTVPSNTERLWVRLQTDNRASEYTCKTKNWRIYPINYNLSLSADKSIIQKNESVVVTALLTMDGSLVSGETLNYQIKHGSTVIDSGTKTTDSNGEATITYTGTGVGDVSVEVTYGTLLQETFVIEDCFKYDPTIQTRTTTYNTDRLTPVYNDFSFISDNFSLECTWQLPNSAEEGIGFGIAPKNQTTPYHHILFGIGTGQVSSYVGNQSSGETSARYGSPSWNTEYQMKIEYTDGTVKLYIDDELKTTYTDRTYFNGETRDIVFLEWNSGYTITLKNIKLKAL